MNTKKCQQCYSEIKGRTDKKFCDDQCRTVYNNRQRTDTSFMRNLNNTLRKNRRVLQELISPDGRTRTSRKRLEDKGFNFTYHTHIDTTRAGTTYFCCYEYGFVPIDSEHYLLVKRSGT